MAKAKQAAARGGIRSLGRAAAGTDDEDDDEDDDAPAAALAAAGAGDEIEQLLEQLGASVSSARIIVHRVTANQDPEECIDCPLATFSKDRLREQFGAGIYSCEVRQKGTIRRRWTWRFAAPIAAPAAVVSSTQAREERLERELREERERASARQHEMMLAIMARPQAEGASLSELISTLSGARELLGGGNAAGGSVISQLKDLLEMRDMLGGDGPGKGAGMMDLALEAMRQLPALAAATGKTPAAPAAPRRLPAPGAAARPDKMSASQPGDGSRAAVVDLLLQHAGQGTDPATVARFAYGKLCELEQEKFDAACEFLDGEGALQLGLMMEPRLEPARAWLAKVLEQLRAVISQGDAESALPGGTEAAQSSGGVNPQP
jgi:hypothetical protein